MENEDEKKEGKSVMVQLPELLSSITNELLNTQAYIRAFAVVTLSKTDIKKFEEEFTKQKDALVNIYIQNK